MTHTNSGQWFGFSRPAVTFGSGLLAVTLTGQAIVPIKMYSFPLQRDVPGVRVDGLSDLTGGMHGPLHNLHLSEASSNSSLSSNFVMVRNFGF